MRNRRCHFSLNVLFTAFLFALLPGQARAQDKAALIAVLPPAASWVEHFQRDIMPFWQTPAALGNPVGNFPTFRCNDGSVVNPQALCPEFAAAPDWIKSEVARQYVRMNSRQIFLYGVAFHLTGDPKYLAWSRAGVRYILDHAFDAKTGAIASYWEGGKAVSDFPERTSQDLAYDLMGLSFYYYLTRDPEVLQPILKVEHYIRQNFYDTKGNFYRWKNQGPDTGRLQLVAQLDQANAYMLLMTPDLPEPEQKQWKAELAQIARTIRSRFYDTGSKMFAGMIPAQPIACVFDREDTDFGHSIKTYWMLYLTGRVTGDKALETFARDGAPGVFQRAFQPASRSWAVKPTCDGKTDTTVSWWMAAELDQAALTFGVTNPDALRYIPATFDFWLKHMVDQRFGEVWDEISLPDFAPKQRPKIHLWKNGFHTAEHALVGYIGTNAVRAEPVTLYYAFPQCKMPTSVRPYYYEGTVTAHQETPLADMPGFCSTKVTFGGVH